MNQWTNNSDPRSSLAVHEAARAVIAFREELSFKSIVVTTRPGRDSYEEAAYRLANLLPDLVKFLSSDETATPPLTHPLSFACSHVVAMLAGPCAEELLVGRSRAAETYIYDLEVVHRLVSLVCDGDDERDAFLVWVSARARRYVRQYAAPILTIAERAHASGSVGSLMVRVFANIARPDRGDVTPSDALK